MFLFFHDSICAHLTFSPSTNNFAHAQTLSQMSSLPGRMNIARVNIEFFTGCKKIKQRRKSFALGYLRMILVKLSTAISIKHRILAPYSILTACMPLRTCCILIYCSIKHLCFVIFNILCGIFLMLSYCYT